MVHHVAEYLAVAQMTRVKVESVRLAAHVPMLALESQPILAAKLVDVISPLGVVNCSLWQVS